ncbi:MAG: hypothetical protein IJI56_02720 [Firmicutes bacterium]|jgi:hypothetical protein|nr:hypothetical protein [Bacillota bacterium]
MNILKAVIDQKKAVKALKNVPVYSEEWWAKIPDTVTFVDPELRPIMVFAVVFGSIQM